MITIYTDKETEALIREIREENPGFNLSEWFRNQLLRYKGKEVIQDPEIIEKEVDNLKLDLEKIENEIKLKEKTLLNMKAERLHEEKERKLKLSLDEQKREDKFKTYFENIKYFYSYLTDDEIRELADEYLQIEDSVRTTIPDFMGKKGFSIKQTEVIK